jgi:hypothetical protein
VRCRCSFAAQPVLLAKLVLLFLYAYLFSIGLQVWAGREKSRKRFIADARLGRSPQPLLIATAHYFCARWILFGSCLGAGVVFLGGFAHAKLLGPLTWLVAWGYVRWQERHREAPKVRTAEEFGQCDGGRTAIGKDVWDVLGGSGTLCNRHRVCGITVYDTDLRLIPRQRVWGLLECLPLMLPILAGFAFLPSALLLFTFLLVGYGLSQLILSRTTIDKQTKECNPNFGLGCINAFAQKRLRFLGNMIQAVLGWAGSVAAYPWLDVLTKRLGVREPAEQETGSRTLAGGLACFCTALALAACTCYGAWIAAEVLAHPLVSPAEAVRTAYTHSYSTLVSLRFRWPSLLPSFQRLWEVINDPGAACQEVLQRLQDVVRGAVVSFANFDPSYFMEGIATLSAINVVVGFLKIIVAYSSKFFQAVDTTLQYCRASDSAGGAEAVTYQVHECLQPPEWAQVEALHAKYALTAGHASYDLEKRGLILAEVQTLAYETALVASVTSINLMGNNLGPEGAIALAPAICDSASLTSINLEGNYLGPEGAKALAPALRDSASVTSVTATIRTQLELVNWWDPC